MASGTVHREPAGVGGRPSHADHTHPRATGQLEPGRRQLEAHQRALERPDAERQPPGALRVEGNSVDTAWETTTGRPSTVIAVTDSGIEWCDPALVDKIYLNRDALPLPENAQGLTKTQLEAAGQHFADTDPYDLDGSGIFNVAQYANDPRIAKPYFCASKDGDGFGYTGISPADLIAAFGTPGEHDYEPGPVPPDSPTPSPDGTSSTTTTTPTTPSTTTTAPEQPRTPSERPAPSTQRSAPARTAWCCRSRSATPSSPRGTPSPKERCSQSTPGRPSSRRRSAPTT